MKRIALMLLAVSLLAFNSCTKTGPQGPQGIPGKDGNANVKGSDPFDVTVWTYNVTDHYYVASFTDADITAAVADHGVVECFLYYPSDGTWRNLPDILYGTQFYFRFSQGGFEIYYSKVDGSVPVNPATLGTWTFRVVVISPSNKQAHPNTDWKNYDAAMAALQDKQGATITQ